MKAKAKTSGSPAAVATNTPGSGSVNRGVTIIQRGADTPWDRATIRNWFAKCGNNSTKVGIHTDSD